MRGRAEDRSYLFGRKKKLIISLSFDSNKAVPFTVNDDGYGNMEVVFVPNQLGPLTITIFASEGVILPFTEATFVVIDGMLKIALPPDAQKLITYAVPHPTKCIIYEDANPCDTNLFNIQPTPNLLCNITL